MKLFIAFFVLCSVLAFGSCQSKKAPTKNATMVPVIQQQSDQKDFKILSNPQSKRIVLVFYSTKTGQAIASIYYEDGKLLQQRNLAVIPGTNTWECYFAFEASGTYMVKFTMNDIKRSGK